MSGSYQPIYDAARRQIGHVDTERVLREAFDISWQKQHLQQEIYTVSPRCSGRGYYKDGTLGPGMYFVMPYSPDGRPGQCCATTSLDQHNANVRALIADGRTKLTPEIHFRLRNERLHRQMDQWRCAESA